VASRKSRDLCLKYLSSWKKCLLLFLLLTLTSSRRNQLIHGHYGYGDEACTSDQPQEEHLKSCVCSACAESLV